MRFFRGIKTNAILKDSKPPTTSSSSSSQSFPGSHTLRPSEWEKTILVFGKKFPNKKSIPETVSMEIMQAAMSRARIRIANGMMIFALLGCLYVVITGKQEAKQVMKNAETSHDEFRRQITAEYKALAADASKK
ncbi:hypothetical protein PV325_002652 [Microctonus aethiopoides]|nr:hypothetical protein PV325_002652 [Microctonus aethiopoides]